jgi:hypothetical protein
LTKIATENLNSTGYSVRWHPTEMSPYYLAVATDHPSSEIDIYSFDGINTITPTDVINLSANANTVAWNPKGNYLAVGTSDDNREIIVYDFTSGTITQTAERNLSPNQNISSIAWAPEGNGNYLIIGANSDATESELLMYLFERGTSPSLTLTAHANINNTVESVDWSPTGTYISVGISGGSTNLRIYKHSVQQGAASSYSKLTEATRLDESGDVYSTHFKTDGTKLAIGLANNPGTEFRTYTFDYSSTPTITLNVGIEASNNINSVRYSSDGIYIARGDDSNYVSVYKPVETSFTFEDVRLFLNTNVTLHTPITFKGNCLINGKGNKFIFDDDGSINIPSGGTAEFKNTTLNFDKPDVFALESRTSKLKFEDTTIELDSDVTIGDGSIEVAGDLVITGPHAFKYASAYTSTIDAFAKLKLENLSTLQVGRNPSVSQQPIEFTDDTSILELENATLNITDSGLQVKKGTVKASGKSTLDIDNTTANYGLIFGDVTSANDAELVIKAGAELNVDTGALVFNTYVNDKLSFEGSTGKLVLNENSNLQINRPIHLTNGWLNPHSSSSITIDSGGYLKTDKTRIEAQNTAEDFYITGPIASLNTMILDRDDEIILNSGNLSKTITVSRDRNAITGQGGFTGQLDFKYDSNASLSWDINTKLSPNNVALNQGEIIFAKDSGLQDNYVLTNQGNINLSNKNIQLGYQDSIWTSSIYWEGNNAVIDLNSKVSLCGTWTFSNSCIINGKNHILDLGTMGRIYVERGATLEFKNILLESFQNSNIKCEDDSSKIIFDNTIISQHDNFTFKQGSIKFKNNVNLLAEYSIGAGYTFYYTSKQTSTIDKHSTFKILDGITFSIGRQNANTQRQPLAFEDQTSILHLNGCTLNITSSGATFLNGKMKASQKSYLDIDNDHNEYSLSLGNETTANDFILEIGGDALLTIQNGRIYYKNYSNENRIVFINEAASLRVDSINGLSTWRNLTVKNGTLRFPLGDSIGTYNNSSFYQDNILHIHDFPYSVHKMKSELKPKAGSSYENEYYLGNDDYFYTLEGNAGVPVNFDSGTSNLGGPGSINANLELRNSGVTAKPALVSNLANNIILNGGKLILNNDLKFVSDKKITGSGTVSLNTHKLAFGTESLNFTDNIYWEASSGMDLNARTTLSSTWTFNGECYLNGNGNVLDLSPGGQLVVDFSSTLHLIDIALKGMGNNQILMMNDNSHLRMSNVYIELTENITTTVGGIYIEGPTTWGLKHYDWTLDNDASMTVDGVTLWKDPLDIINYGNIKYGSGPESNYLSLVSSGTIKATANLDVLSTDTTYLENNISSYEGDIRANSYLINHNSNAIVQNDGNIRANSYLINNNSNAIIQNDGDIRANSYLINNNSNAIIQNDSDIATNAGNIRANSYLINHNSNAIVQNDGDIRANSYLINNNSNAIIQNDSDIATNAGNIRANSYLINHNSNAIVQNDGNIRANSYLINNNSNAIIQNDGDIRANSYLINNNSNAIIQNDSDIATNAGNIRANSYLINHNSNAIVQKDGDIRANSYLINNNSNAIIQNDSDIATNAGNIRANSYLINHNSNAIVQNDGDIRANSYLINNNSNAIIQNDSDIATNAGNIRANSYLINHNSNAIVQNDGNIRANSYLIAHNSNAVNTFGGNIRANSYLIYHNSNAINSISIAATQDNFILTEASNLAEDTNLGGNPSDPSAILVLTGIHTTQPVLIQICATRTIAGSPIDLDGSTLRLYGDFMFSSGTTIESSGNLSPMNHAFLLGGDLSIPPDVQITFSTGGIVDGQGHRLIFNDNSRLKLDSHVSLTLRNIILENIGNTNNDSFASICMNNKDCRLTLQDTKLKLSRNYSFTLGDLYIQDDVLICGTNQFNYTSTHACYIAKNSSFGFDTKTTFSYGPSATIANGRNLIVMEDQTSLLYLDGATLKSTTTGLQLTKGTLIIDHKCPFYNEDEANGQATSVSQAITFGDGNTENNLYIELMPGASIDMKSGILAYMNTN